MTRLASNPQLLTLFQISKMALFPVAVLPLFMEDQCGLSVREIMWLQALFGLVIALSEFPSGYLADRIGYRRTLLIGGVLVFAGWSAYPLASDFWTLLAGEVLLGVGLACVSGCDSALLYASLEATGEAGRFGAVFSRQHSFGQLAEGTAALFAGVLYALSPALPFGLQLIATLAMIACVARLQEPPRQAVARTGSHVGQAYRALRDAFAAAPRLPTLIVLWTLFSLAAYLPVWLFSPYAREAGVPVRWLGPLWAMGNYIVAVGSLSAGTLQRRFGVLGAGTLALAAAGVGYAGLSLSHAALGCAFYFALTWTRGVTMALLTPVEHSLIPSSDRAALVSFRSMLFRLSFFVVGPLVGALVDAAGYHTAFAVAAIPLLLAIAAVLPAALSSRPEAITAPATRVVPAGKTER